MFIQNSLLNYFKLVFMSSGVSEYRVLRRCFFSGNLDYNQEIWGPLIKDENCSTHTIHPQNDPPINPLNRYRGFKFSSADTDISDGRYNEKKYGEFIEYLQSFDFGFARDTWDGQRVRFSYVQDLTRFKATDSFTFLQNSQWQTLLFRKTNPSFVQRDSFQNIIHDNGVERFLYTGPICDEIAVLARGYGANGKSMITGLANLTTESVDLMDSMIREIAQKNIRNIRFICYGGSCFQDKNPAWLSIKKKIQEGKKQFKQIEFSYTSYIDPYQINGKDAVFHGDTGKIRRIFCLYSQLGISNKEGAYANLPGLLSKFDERLVIGFYKFITRNNMAELEDECRKDALFHENLISLIGKVYLYSRSI